MEKKLLVAVDSSRDSENAVRYAAGIHQTLKDMTFTLYHAQSAISQYILDEAERSPGVRAELNKLLKKNDEAARKLLEARKQQMTALGVAEKDIQTATTPRVQGVAKDILEYAITSAFDAIVVGRRGVSGLQAMYSGSVSANIVDNSEVVPVWIVGEKPAWCVNVRYLRGHRHYIDCR